MSDDAVVSLDEYREKNGIQLLLSQPWPKSRNKDFRVAQRAHAEEQTRRVICAHCEKRSRLLTGPMARAWWNHHVTVCRRTP